MITLRTFIEQEHPRINAALAEAPNSPSPSCPSPNTPWGTEGNGCGPY